MRCLACSAEVAVKGAGKPSARLAPHARGEHLCPGSWMLVEQMARLTERVEEILFPPEGSGRERA